MKSIYQFDIAGKTQTFDFGTYCWSVFCERMDVSPADIISAFRGPQTFRAVRIITYCGITAYDYLNGRPASVTEQEVAKWLNDDPQTIGSIFEAAIKIFYGETNDDLKEQA